MEVAAKGSNASPEKVHAALEQLKREDAIVAAGLKAAHQAIEADGHTNRCQGVRVCQRSLEYSVKLIMKRSQN